MKKWIIAIGALGFVTMGCQESRQECERDRMELSRSWSKVREAAIKRKMGGVDVDGWATVESKADLLQSAFQTKQVTWQSAERARSFLEEQLDSLRSSNDQLLSSFRVTIERAFGEQEQYGQKCR